MNHTPSTSLNVILLRQLETRIQMLVSTIEICPDDVWIKADGHPPVWQHVLHTAHSLHKWMRTPDQPFDPPSFIDTAAVDLVAPPEPAVDRDTLRQYIQEVYDHSRRLLETADNDTLLQEVGINGGIYTLMDQTVGQIGHVMYHAGCISIILNRYTGKPLPWIGYAWNARVG